MAEKEETRENKACIAFGMKDPNEAFAHMKTRRVENYGDYAYGHYLHTWDEGERFLLKCEACGGYVLLQKSEYHSFSDTADSYYSDWFPVESPEEADELNRKYDGFKIEQEFPGRYLKKTNGKLGWGWGKG